MKNTAEALNQVVDHAEIIDRDQGRLQLQAAGLGPDRAGHLGAIAARLAARAAFGWQERHRAQAQLQVDPEMFGQGLRRLQITDDHDRLAPQPPADQEPAHQVAGGGDQAQAEGPGQQHHQAQGQAAMLERKGDHNHDQEAEAGARDNLAELINVVEAHSRVETLAGKHQEQCDGQQAVDLVIVQVDNQPGQAADLQGEGQRQVEAEQVAQGQGQRHPRAGIFIQDRGLALIGFDFYFHFLTSNRILHGFFSPGGG